MIGGVSFYVKKKCNENHGLKQNVKIILYADSNDVFVFFVGQPVRKFKFYTYFSPRLVHILA